MTARISASLPALAGPAIETSVSVSGSIALTADALELDNDVFVAQGPGRHTTRATGVTTMVVQASTEPLESDQRRFSPRRRLP